MRITGYFNGVAQILELSIYSDHNTYVAELRIPTELSPVTGRGSNHYEAIYQIRDRVEPAGWLLAVAASRLDAAPPVAQDDYNDDRVTLLGEDGNINVSALQAASYKKLGTILQQRENLQTLSMQQEIKRELEETVTPPEAEETKVVETRVSMPRVTSGVFYALGSYIFAVIFFFIFLPSVDSFWFITGSIIFGVGLHVGSIVKCITDIAYNLSKASQWGLAFLIILPLVWAVMSLVVGVIDVEVLEQVKTLFQESNWGASPEQQDTPV